jgi:hypothetical protein
MFDGILFVGGCAGKCLALNGVFHGAAFMNFVMTGKTIEAGIKALWTIYHGGQTGVDTVILQIFWSTKGCYWNFWYGLFTSV